MTPTEAAARLRSIPAAIARAKVRALNKVAATTRTEASKQIRQAVKLPASYVNKPGVLEVIKAQADGNEAIIRARKRPIRLATYGAKQLTKAAPRAKGDALRGIAAGRKQAGVSVNVTGSRKKMPGAFLIPLKNGNGFGLFTRTGPARNQVEHHYSLSVNQMFKKLKPALSVVAQTKLREVMQTQLAYELGRTL